MLVGAAAFVLFLFLDRWASYSYWFVVVPAAGFTIESLFLQGLADHNPNAAVDTG